MIDIKDKKDCVGCNACAIRCPKQCITMNKDEQGFDYPTVNRDECINCHLCEKVCPVINQDTSNTPLETLAAKNNDINIQKTSSSGGIFFQLGRYIIGHGGVVFGARFNNDWEVIHDYTETIDGLTDFQGSKYLQSKIGDTYGLAERFLKTGRIVMFTGTPCQLAGLRKFLRKDYGAQLLMVDFVCHGVPSPLVWKEYLKYITLPKGASAGENTVFRSLNELPVITGISFRDKRLGWEKFGLSVRVSATEGSGQNSFLSPVNASQRGEEVFESLNDNLYLQIFLKDLDLRPSCYHCPAKRGKSHSDITLADYWGIKHKHPDFYDTNGVSLVMINSTSGMNYMHSIDLLTEQTDYEYAIRCNPAIVKCAKYPKLYSEFWKEFESNGLNGAINILDRIKPTKSRGLYASLCLLCPRKVKTLLRKVIK